LLEQKTFSTETLSKVPLSYQTTDAWYDLIAASAGLTGKVEKLPIDTSSGLLTWLHALHIGINLAERGDVSVPIEYFKVSAEMKPNPIAYRCLAVLSSTYEASWGYYEMAWTTLHRDFVNDPAYNRLVSNMVMEISFFLQQTGWNDIIHWFIDQVPSEHRDIDAYITLEVKYLLFKEDYSSAINILGKNCFPTYAKARDDLINMWNSAQEGLAKQQKSASSGMPSSLNALERHQARVRNPPPENIGCQYAAEVE
jgi:hypothetical protein